MAILPTMRIAQKTVVVFAPTAALVLCAAALLLPGPVASQGAQESEPSLLGRYTLDESTSRVQGRIDRAIDRGIADMNILIRGIARGRVAEYTPIVRNLRITSSGRFIDVSLDGHRLRGNADGSRREVTMPTDDEAQLRVQLNDSSLTQTFTFDEGTRRHVFTLRPDGKLVLQVSMGSEQLPAPISYSMRFRPSRR